MEKSPREEQLLPVKSTIEYSQKVKDIEDAISKIPDPTPDLWMQRAHALAEQRMLREAIGSLSKAIAIDPFCGILYRWRAHRYLNCGEIEEACADFTVASRLIPENWSVWYHLALTYVFQEEFELAEYYYSKCWELPATTARRVALTNWTWITYKNLGKDTEAAKLLENINSNVNAGGNVGYLRLCLFYKGELTEEDVLKCDKENEEERSLSMMTQGFGLANYYKIIGNMKKYEETLDFILDLGKEDGWNCFGYVGARNAKEKLIKSRN